MCEIGPNRRVIFHEMVENPLTDHFQDVGLFELLVLHQRNIEFCVLPDDVFVGLSMRGKNLFRNPKGFHQRFFVRNVVRQEWSRLVGQDFGFYK